MKTNWKQISNERLIDLEALVNEQYFFDKRNFGICLYKFIPGAHYQQFGTFGITTKDWREMAYYLYGILQGIKPF